MSASPRTVLGQRADYTHKHNVKSGRHGWLRLTPAYSVKVVDELIADCKNAVRIFDPFCGTATTALSAAYHGHEGVTTDINPFLVWFGQAKTAHYAADEIASSRNALRETFELLKAPAGMDPAAPPPPIHNIGRWWSIEAQMFLCKLKGIVHRVTEEHSCERTLLLISFCRTLIRLSNAAFNHQSMSFKDESQLTLSIGIDMATQYAEDVDFVLCGAADNPEGLGRVLLGDSRCPAAYVEGKFDRVITSPPYANRMSYIRELRPYMYWLGFLTNGKDAGELDWSAIGGTWGIATSRLNDWQCSPDAFRSNLLADALQRIAHRDNQNGGILSTYVAKYFDDIWAHLRGLVPLLAGHADVHYIVGNSTFYGVLLPTEQLYVAMLGELGFVNVDCKAIRKRNSKKELIEYDVSGHWPG